MGYDSISIDTYKAVWRSMFVGYHVTWSMIKAKWTHFLLIKMVKYDDLNEKL